MVLKAKRICIVYSIATLYTRHRLVTLLAICHVVLHHVTIFVLHNAQNALGFLGNGRMHYYNFYCSSRMITFKGFYGQKYPYHG